MRVRAALTKAFPVTAAASVRLFPAIALCLRCAPEIALFLVAALLRVLPVTNR